MGCPRPSFCTAGMNFLRNFRFRIVDDQNHPYEQHIGRIDVLQQSCLSYPISTDWVQLGFGLLHGRQLEAAATVSCAPSNVLLRAYVDCGELLRVCLTCQPMLDAVGSDQVELE